MRASAVSAPPIGLSTCARIGPLSMPSSSSMTVAPVVVSPSSMALTTGDGPRYFGSSDGCMFRQPSLGSSSISVGRNKPYAATMMASGASRASCAAASVSSRSDAGWKTGMPRSSANVLTGGGVRRRPRPARRSGCVKTPATLCPASRSAPSAGAAKAGVPMKTRFRLNIRPPILKSR